MAASQTKETLLKILAEIDGVFNEIDRQEAIISAKERALDVLEKRA